MTERDELDRLALLSARHRDSLRWASWAVLRLNQLAEHPVRLGRDGAVLCHVCQELYASVADKPYWQGVQAEYLKARNRCLTGGE